jgi:tRNA(adenine34) deaminase
MMLEMNDEDFMKLAIDEAKRSQAAGGAPIGAVMVKDGQVIAKGQSLVWPEKDPSSHGETNCIRNASKVLHPNNLAGCTMYSTLESCSMCLGCAGWIGLSKIVFGAYKEDVEGNPYELADYHAEEHAKKMTPIGGGKIEVVGGVLRDECKQLMSNIKNWSPIE